MKTGTREIECPEHGNLFVPPDTCDACVWGAAALDGAADAMPPSVVLHGRGEVGPVGWLRARARKMREHGKGEG